MSKQSMHTYSDKDLSKVGFSSANKILSSWGCTTEQSQLILGLSLSGYQTPPSLQENIALSKEQFERVSYVLNIHQTLRTLFSNPDNIYGFMSMKNSNQFFNGRSPLEAIISGKLEDLREVACQINAVDTSARIGVAKNSFSVPDDIDSNNKDIAALILGSDV